MSGEESETFSDSGRPEDEPMSRQDSVFSQYSEADSYAGYSEDETMIAGVNGGEATCSC